MGRVLIIGATSDIAKALAREYASSGYDLFLAARDPERLAPDVQDFAIRYGVEVNPLRLDLLDFASHPSFWQALQPRPDGVILAAGYLGDQAKAEAGDWDELYRILATNYLGCVSLLNLAAAEFEQRRAGFIIGIGSVAGERGRKSNGLYGSAKAGLATYLSALRHRLHASGVLVMTVKPGFVRTRMTENMILPEALVVSPERVAAEIAAGHRQGRDRLFTPWFWRFIMLIIRCMPESLFKRTRL